MLSMSSLADWERQIAVAMQCDQFRLRQQVRQLRNVLKANRAHDRFETRFAEMLQRSIARREQRFKSIPKFRFDDELPILAKRDEIASAIRHNQVVIVCGETGSGKSTQLPKFCLSLGGGVAGMIGHTQPRRVAARTIAARVAEEIGTSLGNLVGYKIRFTDATQPNTLIKLMTDGVLLAETRTDRFLDHYDTIIVDEAHERSLNIDFLLGYLKRLLPKRPELKVIITSATIDAARFAEHFGSTAGPVPIIEVSGRMYPVEVRWRPISEVGRIASPAGRFDKPSYEEDELDPQQVLLDAVKELTSERIGDILIFMPTEWDIHETAKLLRSRHAGGSNDEFDILPLYARLSLQEQQRVFETKASRRRIVIATNVAESSLTVPGIRAVIDTGTARISRYSPRTKMQRLPIEAISQASADQRQGRCGRIGPGVCIRLYSETDYAGREKYTLPEILRTNLASVILQTQSLNLGPLEDFPFLEPPKSTAIRDGYKTLFELGAVNDHDELTDLGRKLAKLPVDPRIARIILAGHDEACLHDILIIAAALEAQDPRDRPIDKHQQADEKHKQFQHEDSDFLGYLKLWDFYHHLKDTLSKSQVRKACVQNFLNFNRLREWADLHRQLVELVEESGLKVGKRQSSETQASIHRALVTGFLASIACKDGETSEYSAAGGLKATLWPGSSVGRKGGASKPKWLVAAEMVETSKRYLRTVARIDPAWIEPLAEHLVTRTHSEPHWDRPAGSAMAFEKVSLFGLTIIPRRKVRLGRIDPPTARRLFIQHALVEGDFDSNAEFFVHNRLLIEELEELHVKSRRADFLKGEEAQFEFYDQRLPEVVVDGPSMQKWLTEASGGRQPPDASVRPKTSARPKSSELNPKMVSLDRQVSVERIRGLTPPARLELTTNERLLFFTRDDLLNPEREAASPEDFPNEIKLRHMSVPLEYRLEPGEAIDGITISVPQEGLNQLDSRRLGWLVPGLLEEKITALIKSLPKELRRHFVPVPDTAREVLQQIRFGEGEVTAAMATILSRISGQRVNAEDFREAELPPHLRINVQVLGAERKKLAAGRDLDELRSKLGAKASASFSAIDHVAWNRDGLTDWDFELLPESVDLEHSGLRLKGFPMLVNRGESLSLRLSDSVDKAVYETRVGLRRLFELQTVRDLTKHVQHLPDLSKWQLLTATLPDKGRLPQMLAELIADRALFGQSPTVPRTKTQFQERVSVAKLRIPAAVQEVIELIGPLLAAYTEARRAVEGCKLPFAAAAVTDCRTQLARLTEAGFWVQTPWDWLQQFPRYFQAIALRLKKLIAGGQARDQRSAAEIDPRWHRLVECLDANRVADRYDPELVTGRWMLEELRVSLFAQELRTAIPISPQRFDKQWERVSTTA